MTRRIAAAMFLVLALLLGTARAAPFTGHFGPVRTRLAEMRDALQPPLARSAAKQRAAIEKLIAKIDADSASLTGDVATAKGLASAAAKSLSADPELAGLVRTLLAALVADLRARAGSLSEELSGLLGAKLSKKGPALLSKLETALDAAGASSDLKAIVKSLVKAARGADALARLLAAGGGAGGGGCSSIPSAGADLSVTGTGGYVRRLRQSAPIDAEDYFDQTGVEFGDQVNAGFSTTITLAPADIRSGTVPLLFIQYAGGPGKYYELTPGTGVRVVEESASRVAFCVDVVLPAQFPQFLGPGEPLEVTVKGYVVVRR